jgi:hypothetical protein
MMKKQATLFPQDAVKILAELDLEEAQRTAAQVKAAVEAQCELIEVAGSIRRQKSKVHDIDFVVVAKSDAEWQKINEKLKQLRAKPNCAGNSVIKAFVPCQDGFFQVDFYRAKPSTFGIHLLVRRKHSLKPSCHSPLVFFFLFAFWGAFCVAVRCVYPAVYSATENRVFVLFDEVFADYLS